MKFDKETVTVVRNSFNAVVATVFGAQSEFKTPGPGFTITGRTRDGEAFRRTFGDGFTAKVEEDPGE